MVSRHRITVSDGVCLIKLGGEIDFANAEQMADWLLKAIDDSKASQIDIDLAQVSLVDSSGIGCLMVAHRHAGLKGAVLRVINPMPQVTRVFKATGVAEVLGI
jgi:anti-sigma B factor antagonist